MSKSVVKGLLVAGVLLSLSTSVQAYKLMPFKWQEPQAELFFNLVWAGYTASTRSNIEWDESMKSVLSTWSRLTPFTLTWENRDLSLPEPCAGVTPGLPEDFKKSASFEYDDCGADFGDEVLAITNIYVDRASPEYIVDADIIFNANITWDIYNGTVDPVYMDFARTAMHEVGHFIGLDHVDRADSIMSPYVGDITQPQPDDIAGVAALYPAGGDDPAAPILMALEEPSEGEVKSGVGTFRGWLVSQHELASLTLFRDGAYVSSIVIGDPRADVTRRHPEYAYALNPGFAFATAYGNLAPGDHTYRIQAIDSKGNVKEMVRHFKTTRFDDSWVSDSGKITLDGASATIEGETLVIKNMMHNGKQYDVRMEWAKGAQNYLPVSIIKKTR